MIMLNCDNESVMEKGGNQSHTRLLKYDLLKVFACFLVIWGHVIMHLYDSDYVSNPIYRAIYSFHMNLFMMISGWFSLSSMKMTSKPFFVKKAKQLIYPCIAWGVFTMLLSDGIKILEDEPLRFTPSNMMSDLYWYSDFWFLKSCFVCYSLAFLGTRTKMKKWLWVAVTLLLSQLIPVFQIPFMYPSFLLGMLLKESKSLMDIIRKYKFAICLLFIIMLLFWTEEAWVGSHELSALIKESRMPVADIFLLRLYRLVIGLLGALSFFVIFDAVGDSVFATDGFRKLSILGKFSLEIYIVHTVVFVELLFKYISFTAISYWPFNLLVVPIVSLIVLFTTYKLIDIIYKFPVLSKLLFAKQI